MIDSILNTTKKLLGLDVDYTPFDTDVVVHINTALMVLHQLGVGVVPFHITGPKETWAELFGERADLFMIKTYIYLKVRLAFDPPTSSFVLTSMEKTVQEYEWRINVLVDKGAANV